MSCDRKSSKDHRISMTVFFGADDLSGDERVCVNGPT